MDMKVKVCGITREADLQGLLENGVQYAGFIFYERSPRFVANKLDARTVRETAGISKVGVFVNADPAMVRRTIADYRLDMVQLHGDESPAYCAALRPLVQVIKAFRIGREVNWEQQVGPWLEATDYFLFDTASAHAYGGTGKQFDWELLQSYPYRHPFFLSGGIGPEHAAALQQLQLPALYAVDVNSRFETAPGIKNIVQVARFVQDIHSSYLKSEG